nr:AF4/FMR2 family member 1 isoform X2 [Misgurnus anguillicaudatus]
MEERNVLRQMERERRNQEVEQEETRYDRITPLFNEPYKINKCDELSARIQRMLGNFEDGCDVGPRELCSVFPFGHSVQLFRADGSNCRNSSGHTEGSTPASETSPASFAPSQGSVPKSENCDSNRLPALSPPADPLSPLQSSGVDEPSPELCQAEPSQMEAPPPAHVLLVNLHCKPGLVNQQKPTAYVRPMDGQDQMTAASPDFKASPDTYEHLPDPKNSGVSPNQSVKQPPQSVDIACQVDDILKEMTSWPELLTSIFSPSTRESLTLPILTEEPQAFPTPTHESDSVEQEHQADFSISSTSDSSSSDNEIVSPEKKAADVMSPHTRVRIKKDWQLRRWLYSRENQQNSEGPCYVIMANSHDSHGKTEAIGQPGCYSNPTQIDIESDHTQTVMSTCAGENLQVKTSRLENSQRNKNPSVRRAKESRKKTEKRSVRVASKTRDLSICVTKHTERKLACRPLLVKIELNLLSRIPQEPKTAPPLSGVVKRPGPRKPTGHKRPAERDETSQRKKMKMETPNSSSQNIISGSKVTVRCGTMKKSSVKQKQIPPDREQQKTAAHLKKACESHDAPAQLTCPSASKPRVLLQLDRRPHSVEDHMREAKKLKHKADATLDKMSKALSYLEAALSFVESGVAMETDPQTPKSAYTMFSETVELIRFILKLKNYTDPTAAATERDFLVLCLRCESLLQMAMFRYRRDSALKCSRTLVDHFKVSQISLHFFFDVLTRSYVTLLLYQSASPVSSGGTVVIPQDIQQVAASYVEITALFLNALDAWDQADEVALRGSGLLRELDCAVGPLSLASSASSLVQYARHGLHWIRLEP